MFWILFFLLFRSGSSRAQGGNGTGDSEVPSDQTLSDLLDQVIESMPEADRTAPDVSSNKSLFILNYDMYENSCKSYWTLKHLMKTDTTSVIFMLHLFLLWLFFQCVKKEKTAMINAITQSLMQCETASKSPVSSPGTPPVFSVQSPVNIFIFFCV